MIIALRAKSSSLELAGIRFTSAEQAGGRSSVTSETD